MQTVFQDLVAVDVEAQDTEEIIRTAGQMLLEHGFVKDSYIQAVIEREKIYPTGLKLQEIAVAMPHTDREHVIKPGVCVVKLEKPVIFAHMGEPDTKVEVEIIFMMSILHPDEQIETLQKVLGVFQQPAVVADFKNAVTKEELFEVAMKHIG